MKKLILLLAVAIASVFATNAEIKTNSYRGFVDLTYGIGVGNNTSSISDFEITTVHGYQFNDNIFFGGGIGVQIFHQKHFSNAIGIPFFADFRYDTNPFGWDKASLYGEGRLGASVGDTKGVYFNPQIGVRFNLPRNLGLNFGMGYTLQQVTDSGASACMNFINFRLGLDF